MLYTLHVPKIISYLSVSHDNEKYISSMEESPPSTFSLSHSFKSTLKLVLYLSFMYIDVTEKKYTVTRARESCEYSLSYKIINTHFLTDVPLAWLPW